MLILPEGVRQSRLISDAYLAQQKQLHENPDYGVASTHYAGLVGQTINTYKVSELLDYGAGKGRLVQTLIERGLVDHAMRFQHYEPAVEHWADTPEPAEMVACIDVLEHIEPDLLDNVLDDLQRVTRAIGFYSVSTVEAMKSLPDGRNAHLIVEPPEWWLPKIMERWELHVFQRTQDGFCVLVMSKELGNSI